MSIIPSTIFRQSFPSKIGKKYFESVSNSLVHKVDFISYDFGRKTRKRGKSREKEKIFQRMRKHSHEPCFLEASLWYSSQTKNELTKNEWYDIDFLCLLH